MKKIIPFLLLALTACNSNYQKQNDTAAFKKFVSLIPVVKLPFVTSCVDCCKDITFENADTTLQKFVPEGEQVVGLLFNDSNRVGILFSFHADDICPDLHVFDTTGKEISKQAFMTGWCGEDAGVYYQINRLRIDKDMTITEIDSAYTSEMDSISPEVFTPRLVKTSVTKSNYVIDDKGNVRLKMEVLTEDSAGEQKVTVTRP